MKLKHLFWTVILLLALSAPLKAGLPGNITLEQIDTVASNGNNRRRPVAIRNAGDGSDRLFIVLQNGEILIYANDALLPTPFLDISDKVDDAGNEQGLLGLAFHPDFPNNGNNYFYVNYTRNVGAGILDRTVIARYSVPTGTPNVADANSEQVLLEIEQDFGNHNGGDLHFGPDNYLYIGMGDGGSAGDPNQRSQDLSMLLGKMLRIDVDGTPLPEPNNLCGLNPSNYSIPAGNLIDNLVLENILSDDFETQPDSLPTVCAEIWALGLRNPWRFSFDRDTGDMFIGDVGQGSKEEISFQAAATGGLNFGWRCFEGDDEFEVNNDPACMPPVVPFTDPIITYGRSEGVSVAGGFRYRGAHVPLQGFYIYADTFSGRIWFASENAGVWSTTEWMNTDLNIASFGEDESGELYAVTLDGGIHRFSTF